MSWFKTKPSNANWGSSKSKEKDKSLRSQMTIKEGSKSF